MGNAIGREEGEVFASEKRNGGIELNGAETKQPEPEQPTKVEESRDEIEDRLTALPVKFQPTRSRRELWRQARSMVQSTESSSSSIGEEEKPPTAAREKAGAGSESKRRSSDPSAGVRSPGFANFFTKSLALKKTTQAFAKSRARVFSKRLLELVKNEEAPEVAQHISRSPVANFEAIEQILTQNNGDNAGWTALHFAAKQKSSEILHHLVKYSRACPTVINSKTTDGNEWTPLHIAVRKGCLECVKALLSHNYIELNVQDVKGSTPLHHACRRGFPDIFIALAEREETSFSITDLELNFPLNVAVNEHHSEIFDALKRSPDISQRICGDPHFKSLHNVEGNTLLLAAIDITEADDDTVQWCIENGYDIKAINRTGFTPIHIAARRGFKEIAQMLLEKQKELGGDVGRYVNIRTTNQSTPLYLAAKFNQHHILDLLISNGAEVEASEVMGFTPLIEAIRYTNSQCVKKLLANNADILKKDRKRHLSALLWAVEAQSPSILRAIIKHADKTPQVARQMWKERDPGENTAHHLAARASNLDILETLVQYDGSCLEEKNKDGCTPFHVAVKEGKLAIVSYILSNAQSSTYALDGQKSSGLHLAAEKGHKTVAERLVTLHDFGSSVCTRNANGWTPIHLSGKNGHHSVLEFLLEQSPVRETMEILDNKQATALYLACQNGHPKCVEILLAFGAMVTYTYSDPGSDKKIKMNCLEIAINNDHMSVVSLVLKSSRWEHSLQFCKDPNSSDGDTPLRKLIKKMPKMAKIVFDKCISQERLTDTEHDSYYFKVHYNYEFLEDFRDLFKDGGPRVSPEAGTNDPGAEFDNPTDATNLALMANISSIGTDSPMSTIRRQRSSEADYTSSNIVSQPLREPLAQDIDYTSSWAPAKYDYRNHPLNLMVHHKRQDLLKHPLVASFIHYKWNLFGKYMYYPNILIYVLLMLMLSIYMHLHLDYARELTEATERGLTDCFMVEEQNQTLEFLLETNHEHASSLLSKKRQLIVWAVLIIINSVVRIALEIAQVVHHRVDYFLSPINYLEAFLYISTIVFVTNFHLNCVSSWRWQLGALCIFLSWWNFILFLSQQPTVGIYVVMFQHIMNTFVHMAPMSILLILAFGQPFFMLLSPVVADNSTQPFFSFQYSLLKTLTMTVGEFETDPLFYSVPNIITYPVVTYFLWIVFLIIMPLLLHDMLVGLAVDDIKGVQEKAALKKEALQIEFILDVLSRIPKPIIRLRNSREYTQRSGKGRFDKFCKWITGQSWKPDLKVSRLENNMFVRLDSMGESIIGLESRMQEMSEQSVKLEKMIETMIREQERYLEPQRKQTLARRRSSVIFRSVPVLNTLDFATAAPLTGEVNDRGSRVSFDIEQDM